jgi:uncharacterized membrane protein
MPSESDSLDNKAAGVKALPLLAALLAVGGLADAIYLTVHHYTGEKVPCSLVEGCEIVLNSAYAEIAGIPLALFGAAAYFVAFSLSILAAFGNHLAWRLFCAQVTLMFSFTLWLIYLQQFVIGAFCQFCLISAALTTLMFLIAAVTFFSKRHI